MHEIVTLQLGHRANFTATHFWNTQESYFTYDPDAPPSVIDHDVLFRSGLNPKGEETFTPRTLIYDLKGGFGGLRKWGGLYDQELSLDQGLGDASPSTIWNGKVALQQESKIPQSSYQQSLEAEQDQPSVLNAETVRYWSDYNRVYYHPRSINQLSDHELNSTVLPFERFETGEEVFQNINREDDILDRDVRLFAEECDLLQGYQVLASNDDAWGGFASRYIEALRDEYGKIPIWTWTFGDIHNQGSRSAQALRSLNFAKVISELSALDSYHVPMSIDSATLPQYVHLDLQSQWSTAGLLSAAVDSMTIPTRVRPDGGRQGRFADFEAALNTNGNQRIVQLQCSASAHDTSSTPASSSEAKDDRIRMRSTTGPVVNADDGLEDGNTALDVDLVGLPEESRQGRVKATKVFAVVQALRGVANHGMPDEVGDDHSLLRKRRRFANKTVTERYFVDLSYPILDSFPPIFGNAMGGKVDMIASLSTSSSCVKSLLTLQQKSNLVASINEREALSNSLAELSEAYREGWDSDDEPDSDD